MKLPKPPETPVDAAKPKSTWDTIIVSTPVVMTVLATILAGLSSSEMSQAQYYRSMSAQNQSKAGDQWNFFQAKKLRGANAITSVELLQNLGDVGSLTPDAITGAVNQLLQKLGPAIAHASGLRPRLAEIMADPDVKRALEITTQPLPPLPALAITDSSVREAFETIRKNQADSAPPAVFAAINDAALRESLKAAQKDFEADDALLQPAGDGIRKLQTLLDTLSGAAVSARRAAGTQPSTAAAFIASDRESPGAIRQLATDFTAAKFRFEAVRYDREARLNQRIAWLYEVGVRKTSWQSDRSRIRSRYFFYGMLAAQAAVTIATLSLAVRERSWMWSVAASIGVLAMSYAGYVYLFT